MQKIKSSYHNLKRTSLVGAVVFLIFAIANVVPVVAAPETVILDFDSLPTGTFVEHHEDGFCIQWIGHGDYQTISDVAGNHVLKDPWKNSSGAGCFIYALDGSTFYFNSLDYNNFNNNSGSFRIDVWAFPHPFSWGTAKTVQLQPTSSTFSTLTSAALGVEGVELCQMRVNIVSYEADYSVDNINLTPIVQAAIDIAPETLNLKSKGVFTTHITLPEGYDVADIDIGTVTCEGASAIRGVVGGDALIAKFNRQDLTGVQTGEAVTLTVSGNLLDGTPFEGSDSIRVIDKGNN